MVAAGWTFKILIPLYCWFGSMVIMQLLPYEVFETGALHQRERDADMKKVGGQLVKRGERGGCFG